MVTAACVRCKNKIEIGSLPTIGQRLICPNCKSLLEVLWLYPISLDFPEEEIGFSESKPAIDGGLSKTLEA